LYLARDVLDKQIIDTDGVRVVRVTILELARVNGQFYVANVDIGGWGPLRRLGLPKSAQTLSDASGEGCRRVSFRGTMSNCCPAISRCVSRFRAKNHELHPADLGRNHQRLTRAESGKLLESLDAKDSSRHTGGGRAGIQASLVETMPMKRWPTFWKRWLPTSSRLVG